MEETTIFIEAFGNSPVIRVLDFLIEGRELDYSLTDIAKNSGVGWTNLHRIWDNMARLGLVKRTRTIGKAKLFRLDMESDVIKKLIKVYDALIVQQTEKTLNKKLYKKIEVMH